MCDCGYNGDVNNDADGDTVPDCIDVCIDNPQKKTAEDKGACDCSYNGDVNNDADGDKVPDCIDVCADNSEIQNSNQQRYIDCGCDIECELCPEGSVNKSKGVCGCNVVPITEGANINTGDTDKDGVLDCLDACPNNKNNKSILTGDSETDQNLIAHCQFGDADDDGLYDYEDACPTNSDTSLDKYNCYTETNAGYDQARTFIIRHALDFAELKRQIENAPNAEWTIQVENDINLAYDYLDIIDGTPNYEIITTDSACYVQMPSISLFNASFNGNHHSITATYNGMNCTLDRPLFNLIDHSTIRDLRLDFSAGYRNNGSFSNANGLLAADVTNGSQLHGISIKGNVFSNSISQVGGIAGNFQGNSSDDVAAITDCYAENIEIDAPYAESNGGLFGTVESAIIKLPKNTNVVTSISGADNTGGLFGKLSANVRIEPMNSNETINTSIGTVTGSENVGGFVGSADCGSSERCTHTIHGVSHKASQVSASGCNAGGFVGKMTGTTDSLYEISSRVSGKVYSLTENECYDATARQYIGALGGFAGAIINEQLGMIHSIKSDVSEIDADSQFLSAGAFIGLLKFSKLSSGVLGIQNIQNQTKSITNFNAPLSGFIAILYGDLDFSNISSFANLYYYMPSSVGQGYKIRAGGLFAVFSSKGEFRNVVSATSRYYYSTDRTKYSITSSAIACDAYNEAGIATNLRWFVFDTAKEKPYDSSGSNSPESAPFVEDETNGLIQELNENKKSTSEENDLSDHIVWTTDVFELEYPIGTQNKFNLPKVIF